MSVVPRRLGREQVGRAAGGSASRGGGSSCGRCRSARRRTRRPARSRSSRCGRSACGRRSGRRPRRRSSRSPCPAGGARPRARRCRRRRSRPWRRSCPSRGPRRASAVGPPSMTAAPTRPPRLTSSLPRERPLGLPLAELGGRDPQGLGLAVLPGQALQRTHQRCPCHCSLSSPFAPEGRRESAIRGG